MSQQAVHNPAAAGSVEPRRCPVRMLFCAGATLLLYLMFPRIAAMISSARPSHAGEVFPWVEKVTDGTLAVLHAELSTAQENWRFFLFCAALFAIYALMLRLAKGCRSLAVQSMIFGTGAVCLLSLLFSPVMLSTDTFAYAFYGRALSVHGVSPYVENPQLVSDPFYALFNGQSLVSLYGPLWTLISAWITRLAGDRVGVTVLMFRGFSAFSALGAAAFIWKSLRIYAPERAAQGLVMFLWNPLVIIESGLCGHNDATMVALAALGVWLHLKGWKTGTVVALMLSALVKFITGMLVPLYILMVLRGMKTWRERILFLVRSGVCAGAVMAAVLLLADVKITLKKDKSAVPAQSQATSPAFYMNNFHELVFKWLRSRLGENSEPLMAPTDGTFQTWFAIANRDTVLLEEPPEDRHAMVMAAPQALPPVVAHIAKGRKLITITPTLIPWLRVYDSASGKLGYVFKLDTDKLPNPGQLDPDPKLEQLELPVAQWPSVVTANRWIRIVTWALFAVFGLLAAWKADGFDRFLVWSGAALLASYFLVLTQIWPWYILWALLFGALKPERLPARLAVLVSGFVLTFYLTIGYDAGDQAWIYSYRSLPAIVLPFVIFLVTLLPWNRGAKVQQPVPVIL